MAAVLGSARGCGAAVWFAGAPKELQPLLLAMLVARVIEPSSKLATHRLLHDEAASSSLGRVLGAGQCSADELYPALDWLHEARAAIEQRLARQHLAGSTLVPGGDHPAAQHLHAEAEIVLALQVLVRQQRAEAGVVTAHQFHVVLAPPRIDAAGAGPPAVGARSIPLPRARAAAGTAA